MYSHYSAYSSPLDACHRCSLQHYETTVNLYGINCEFAFPLLRIHCSLHLRFHDQLLVAVCAFINLPLVVFYYYTDVCCLVNYDGQSAESDMIGCSKASYFIRIVHLLTRFISSIDLHGGLLDF